MNAIQLFISFRSYTMLRARLKAYIKNLLSLSFLLSRNHRSFYKSQPKFSRPNPRLKYELDIAEWMPDIIMKRWSRDGSQEKICRMLDEPCSGNSKLHSNRNLNYINSLCMGWGVWILTGMANRDYIDNS